jgi:peptidoglycan/LPS O-acetylase OafA/YrhL
MESKRAECRIKSAFCTNTQSEQLTHPEYRADIDGLRAVAVLLVVGFHASPLWVKGGFVGVDIFFVISGFLISTIIFGSLERNTFSFIEFYSRRVKRIFPALLLVLITCFAFGWFALLADEYKQLGKHIAAGAGFVSNLVLWSESGYFDNAGETKPLLHLWSLGIEEQFYIVWPLLLWAVCKTRFNILTITIAIATASFALNIWGIRIDSVATFYSPQTRFWELFAGSLLAWLTLHRKAAKFHHGLDHWLGVMVYAQAPKADGSTLRNVQAWLGAALIVAAVALTTKSSQFPGWWAVLPTLGAVLMIAAGMQAWLNRVVLSNKMLVWFGLISFPLYLWHWPLLSFARIVESEVPTRNIRIAAVLLSVLLAWLTYKLIERPIRFGPHSRARTIVLLVLMVIVGYVGYNAYQRDGLKFRDPTTDNAYIAQTIEQQFSDKCSRRFNKINHCAEQIKAGQSFVLLVGDSHVRHTYELIKEQVANANHGLVAFSNGGCPFLVGVNTANVNDCAAKNSEVMNFIKSNWPQIKAIVLAGEFSTYIRPDWLKTVDGEPTDLGVALSRTLAQLRGVPVIMFEQIPPISFDPKKCLSRPFRITANDFNCQMSYGHVMTSLETSRKAIHKATEAFSNVTLFNVDSELCGGGVCSAVSNNQLLYYDTTHLNPVGVDFVRSKIQFGQILSTAMANY